MTARFKIVSQATYLVYALHGTSGKGKQGQDQGRGLNICKTMK
jgi:hypothetical protein